MKRIIAIILSVSVVAAAFTGCKNNNDTSSSVPTETSTVSGTETESVPTETSVVSDIESVPEVSDNSDSVSDNLDEDAAGDDDFEEPIDANAKLEYPDTRAGELMKKALSVNSWGFMSLTAEQEIIDALIGTDLKVDDVDDILIAYTDNSAQLYTVIIAKPKSDKTDVVTSSLKAYIEKVQNDENLSFYPAQQESAAGAVFEELSDGYLAVIVNENGQTIADTLKE